jgi:hypothetical protein
MLPILAKKRHCRGGLNGNFTQTFFQMKSANKEWFKLENVEKAAD